MYCQLNNKLKFFKNSIKIRTFKFLSFFWHGVLLYAQGLNAQLLHLRQNCYIAIMIVQTSLHIKSATVYLCSVRIFTPHILYTYSVLKLILPKYFSIRDFFFFISRKQMIFYLCLSNKSVMSTFLPVSVCTRRNPDLCASIQTEIQKKNPKKFKKERKKKT